MLLPVIDWKDLWNKRGLKRVLISGGAVLGLTGIGVAGYYLWGEAGPKPPPPIATATAEDDAEYAASDDFSRLPMNRRLAWVEGQIRKASEMDDEAFFNMWKNIGEDKRNRIRDNMREVMRERTKRHVAAYHKLPASERTAFIDERIDEMNRWRPKIRKVFGRLRVAGPRGAGSGRDARAHGASGRRPSVRGASAGRGQFQRSERRAMRRRFRGEMQRFMVRESPDRRAKTMAYVSAIAARRAERGMSRLFGGGQPR